MGNEIEFSLRVEFFDDLKKADRPYPDNGYAGSMMLDGVTAVCAPRVGDEIHPLNRWMPIDTGRVSGVEHRLGGSAAPPKESETKPSPSLTVVIEAKPSRISKHRAGLGAGLVE